MYDFLNSFCTGISFRQFKALKSERQKIITYIGTFFLHKKYTILLEYQIHYDKNVLIISLT